MTKTQIFSRFHSAVLTMIALMAYVVPTNAAISDEAFLELSSYGTFRDFEQALILGANPNARDPKFGTTALMKVSTHVDEAILRVHTLLARGADVNGKNNDGTTALMYAAESNNYNSPDVIKILINAGAHVNANNDHGDTALKCAATFNGYINTFRILLGAGAVVDVPNNDGLTALMEAARRNRHEVVALLLNAGANPYIKDKFGHDALWHARSGRRDVNIWTRAERKAEDKKVIQLLQGR